MKKNGAVKWPLLIAIAVIALGFLLLYNQLHQQKRKKEARERQISFIQAKKIEGAEAAFPLKSSADAPVSIQKEFVELFQPPLARIYVKNISSKTIKSFEAMIFCFDDNNASVKERFSGDAYNSVLYNESIQPMTIAGGNCAWKLRGFEGTKKIRVNINRVKFSDGTEWTGDAVLEPYRQNTDTK